MKGYYFCNLVISFVIIGLITCDEEDPCSLLPDNTFIGDPTSCQNYIYCLNGVSMKGKCPDGLYFNIKYGTCEDSSSVDCKDDHCDENTEGDFLPDYRRPKLCSAFLYCRNGIAEPGNCPNGLHFDDQMNACNYPNPEKCKDEPQFCANIPDKTVVRDVDNCEKYFICSDNLAKSVECEGDKLFNQKTGKCDDKDKVDCEIVCKKEDEDVHKRNPKSCRNYYSCNDGDKKLEKCRPFEMVKKNSTDLKFYCVNQMEVDDKECSNRCDGRKTGFEPLYERDVNTRCIKYHPCKDGKVNSGITYECPTPKRLDVSKQKCVPENEIIKETCLTAPKPDPTTQPPLPNPTAQPPGPNPTSPPGPNPTSPPGPNPTSEPGPKPTSPPGPNPTSPPGPNPTSPPGPNPTSPPGPNPTSPPGPNPTSPPGPNPTSPPGPNPTSPPGPNPTSPPGPNPTSPPGPNPTSPPGPNPTSPPEPNPTSPPGPNPTSPPGPNPTSPPGPNPTSPPGPNPTSPPGPNPEPEE